MASTSTISNILLPEHADEPGDNFVAHKFIERIRRLNEPHRLLTQVECDRAFWSIVLINPRYADRIEQFNNDLDGPGMRKTWAEINLSRTGYSDRPPHPAKNGYFDFNIQGRHYQIYLPRLEKIIEIPPSYEGIRLVARDKPKSGKNWPKLVLNVVDFIQKLIQLNPRVPLTAEDMFWVWHHIITVEYQTELPAYQEKAINDAIDAELFHPAQDKLEKSRCVANALFLPAVYNASHSGDPRRSHTYMWFLRAVLCLNYPKVPARTDVEGAWKEIGERKAALNTGLSSAFEKYRYVRQWTEAIEEDRVEPYWLAIDKYMKHDNPQLAPPPITCLNVAISKNNIPYPLSLQHDFGPELEEATKAIKAKSIQPLPIIPLTMTNEQLYFHFLKDLAAVQPPGVTVDDESAKRIFGFLTGKRAARLKKMANATTTKNE